MKTENSLTFYYFVPKNLFVQSKRDGQLIYWQENDPFQLDPVQIIVLTGHNVLN